MTLIIYDTECTTWEGAMDRMWTGAGEYREIVQIGALKIDCPGANVIDALDIIVRPKINPQVSPFFEKLTGITQARIDAEGVPFSRALKAFLDFCGTAPSFAHGPDHFVLAENVALNQCHPGRLYTNDAPRFINIRPLFMQEDDTLKTAPVNSGRLWQHYGLPRPDGAGEHDGLFDCYSILAAVQYLALQGRDIIQPVIGEDY